MINDDELIVVSFLKMLPFPPQVWSARVWWVCHLERQVLVKRKKEQDPVSTMQKTCWTNHSAFQSGHSSSLIRYGLVLFEKKCFANIMEKEKMLWTGRIEGSKALIGPSRPKKSFTWGFDHLDCRQQPFSCIQSNFGMVTNNQTYNQVKLEQTSALDQWEGSLLQFLYR